MLGAPWRTMRCCSRGWSEGRIFRRIRSTACRCALGRAALGGALLDRLLHPRAAARWLRVRHRAGEACAPRDASASVVSAGGRPTLRWTLADAGERAGAAFLLDLLILVGGSIVPAGGDGQRCGRGRGRAGDRRRARGASSPCAPSTSRSSSAARKARRAGQARPAAAGGGRAHGGPLTAEAVFARSPMREVEFFVPLVALLAPVSPSEPLPGRARLCISLGWLDGVFALLPLFNSDRLRPGDLAWAVRAEWCGPHARAAAGRP